MRILIGHYFISAGRILLIGLLLMINYSLSAQEIQWAVKFSKERVDPPELAVAANKADKSAEQNATHILHFEYARPKYVSQLVLLKNVDSKSIKGIYLVYDSEKRVPLNSLSYQLKGELEHSLLLQFNRSQLPVTKVEVEVKAPLQDWQQPVLNVGLADFKQPEVLSRELLTIDQMIWSQASFVFDQKEALSTTVNSKFPEAKPLVSQDGKTLYFCRQNYPGNTGGVEDMQDIYFSELRNGEWSEAKNMGEPFNNKEPNGLCALGTDDRSMLLINHYSSNETAHGASITRMGKNKWLKPEPLIIKKYDNLSPYADFYQAANDWILLGAIEQKDSKGEQDLYVSFKHPEGYWMSFINLGGLINSSGAEYAPYLAPDSRTLFFTSEGHRGMGGADVYVSFRLDESWQYWTVPQNLGPAVNGAGQDSYFSVTADGQKAYFISSVKEGEQTDIYQVRLKEKLQEVVTKETGEQ